MNGAAGGAVASSPACAGCAAALPVGFLACPSCGQLVHSAELKRLATEAEQAEQAGRAVEALATWRRALALLPPASVQHQRVSETVQRLSNQVGPWAASASPPKSGTSSGRRRSAWGAGALAAGGLLLKFKWGLLFLLGKGKLLLVGLTQAKTFLSMAIAVGVYTAAFGWKFALGLIVSLYIHEMGHVAWLRHYGIPATAPMFIPGFGAFVRLKQHPATRGEDARVGLAGPLWGAMAALGFLIVGGAAGWPSWVATARVGAWINLFNLLPVWQLDGGRGFVALSRRQRGWVAAVLWGLALFGGDGLLFILAIAATARAAAGADAPAEGDRGVFWNYLLLALGFTLLIRLIPVTPR
jgi:Zn-dependent protease